MRLSPYVQSWTLIAVWMFGGLAIMSVAIVNDRGAEGLAAVLVLMVVVAVLSSRIRCPRCREPVGHQWMKGARQPWYAPLTSPICTKCGESLLTKGYVGL